MQRSRRQHGFSLIEVIFALMIITTLSLSLTTLMRGSFDIRESLGQNDQVSHRLATAMARISNDLQHVYVLSEKDLGRFGDTNKRKIRSNFEIILNSSGDTIRMTTMSHVPLIKNANESDTTFVVYKVENDKETGRPSLLRGESKRVPEDFKEDPVMRVLATDIKSFKVRAWSGEAWLNDNWDSSRRETRGLVPHMVQVEIESYLEPVNLEAKSSRALTTADEPAMKYGTAVMIPGAKGLPELKSGFSSVRWDRL